MPTLTVKDNIKFYYTDSGEPQQKDYTTVILIHGHTFHHGIFKNLFPVAKQNGLRIITPNRRAFEGTTPYTQEELDILNNGSDEQRRRVLNEQGIHLAHFVDGIITEAKLPKNKVAVGAWSLGSSFLLMLMSSILLLDESTQARLREHVKTFIYWDVPSRMFAFDDPPEAYVPLYDPDIPAAERGPKFVQWLCSYFTHPDISTRKPGTLNFREPDPTTTSLSDVPFENFGIVGDLASGDKGDTIIGETVLKTFLAEFRQQALFSAEVRKAWGHPNVYHIYGNKNPWNVIYSVWCVEDGFKNVGADHSLTIKWKEMDGSNHFGMWDRPEVAIATILECVEGR